MNSILAVSRRAATSAAAAAVARRGVPLAGAGVGVGVRTMATQTNPALMAVYNNIWKSNPMYITYIIGGCVVLEFCYGRVGDVVFNSINKGKQFDDIDWSKFVEEEEEEEEEEEDDE